MDMIDRRRTSRPSSSAAARPGSRTGYHLAKRGREFVILDAYERVGDNWRCHWDSLRLYSPALAASLPGMRFPAPRTSYPTKDEMADFLETYRAKFELPVRGGRAGEQGAPRRGALPGRRAPTGRPTSATTWSSRPGRSAGRRTCRPSPASWTRGSGSCTPATTSGPAQLQTGRRAGGRRVALRRRHRVRGRLRRPPGGAQRADPRAGALPPGEATREGRLPRAVLPGPARAHPADPDRAQDPPRDPGARRPAASG